MGYALSWVLGALTVLGLQATVGVYVRVRRSQGLYQSEQSQAWEPSRLMDPAPSPPAVNNDEPAFLTDMGFRYVTSHRRPRRPVRPGPRGSIVQ